MPPTLEAIAARLGREAPLSERLPLQFGGERIDVESNSPELVATLRDYFEAFDELRSDAHAGDLSRPPDLVVRAHQMPPPDLGVEFIEWKREPGKDRRKEAYFDLADGRVVRKVRTDMQFLVGESLRVAFGDCLANPNQVINFINFQVTTYLMNSGLVLCHAAGVVENGAGLALAAIAGGGKSTLALHLMSAGLAFTSNDRLLVGPIARSTRGGTEAGNPEGIEMVGIPKHPRINPGTALANPDLAGIVSDARRAELEKLPTSELWELEEKYDAVVDRVYGPGRVVMRAPLKALVLLTWSHWKSTPATFREVPDLGARPDLLDAIMKSPGPFYRPVEGAAPTGYEPPDPGPYLEALRGVPVFEATGGVEFERGVEFCRGVLRG